MQYSIEDLVRLARRDNNSIRPYLYVNPLQGKHIPTKPEDTLDMCRQLAEIVNAAYPKDDLYVIGFAETATGIASAVCCFLENVIYYQNTTRENKIGEDYLYFTESHSHAVDQMLRSSEIERGIFNVDRIVFIDDEITTGNTICKLIDKITGNYKVKNIKYSIVSILNSMTKERMRELRERGVDCLFLAELPFEYKKESIIDIKFEPENNTTVCCSNDQTYDLVAYNTSNNPRSIVSFKKYYADVLQFVTGIKENLHGKCFGSVLVLGTEEFMFPAIYLGRFLEMEGSAIEARVHATTRSPIIASEREDYPLNHRYQIRSVYDPERCTYVYNLRQYDKVIVVTDSDKTVPGLEDLLYALKSVGNSDILVAQWKYE